MWKFALAIIILWIVSPVPMHIKEQFIGLPSIALQFLICYALYVIARRIFRYIKHH